MLVTLIKAFLVGICASAPLGPVVAYVIQVTLSKGRRVGMMAGYGSALIDTSYAIIAVFALELAQAFLDKHPLEVGIIGGAILVLIGVRMLLRKKIDDSSKKNSKKFSAKYPLQTALMALSNPAAIVAMFVLMTAFKVDTEHLKGLTILGVACGTVFWWTVLAWAIDKLGKKLNVKTILIINRILGAAVILFGLWLAYDGMTKRGIISF